MLDKECLNKARHAVAMLNPITQNHPKNKTEALQLVKTLLLWFSHKCLHMIQGQSLWGTYYGGLMCPKTTEEEEEW